MKLPRNSKCPCESGKKWKKCCEQPRAVAVASLKEADETVSRMRRRDYSGYYLKGRPRYPAQGAAFIALSMALRGLY